MGITEYSWRPQTDLKSNHEKKTKCLNISIAPLGIEGLVFRFAIVNGLII